MKGLQALPLLTGIKTKWVITAKAYDATKSRISSSSKEELRSIPPKSNRKDPQEHDWGLYKQRNLIEL
jgi:hypothetical protein